MKKNKKTKNEGTERTNGTEVAGALMPADKPDEFKTLRRAEVFPDPDQPRKTFNQAALEELAESIKEQGIVQPLIVRFVPAKYRLREPDLTDDQWHVEELMPACEGKDPVWVHAFQHQDELPCRSFAGEQNLVSRYMIVAGERRWRAAEIAGLTEVPCIVRDMDARKIFAQQIIENNQREAVSAIEEARALLAGYERRRETEPALKKEDFAKEVGMSRADFYGTLVLTRLHKPVEEALLAGKLSTSQAKVLAIVPLPNQQEALLKEHLERLEWGDGYSVRKLQDEIDRRYVRQLKSAPFDTEKEYPGTKKFPAEVWLPGIVVNGVDPMIVKCTECPFRTGNMLEAYPHLKDRPNICTHVQCFELKCKEYWKEQTACAAEKGKEVMTERDFAAVKDKYVAGDKQVGGRNLDWNATMEKAMGKHKPEPVLVSTKKGLRKFYPIDEALAAAKKNGAGLYESDQEKLAAKAETPEQKAKREEKEKEAKARGERLETFMATQWPVLAAALPKIKPAVAWEIAGMLIDKMDGYTNHPAEKALEKALKKGDRSPQVRVLVRLLTDAEHIPVEGYDTKDWNDNKLVFEAWNLAGIDLKAEFEKAEKGGD